MVTPSPSVNAAQTIPHIIWTLLRGTLPALPPYDFLDRLRLQNPEPLFFLPFFNPGNRRGGGGRGGTRAGGSIGGGRFSLSSVSGLGGSGNGTGAGSVCFLRNINLILRRLDGLGRFIGQNMMWTIYPTQ